MPEQCVIVSVSTLLNATEALDPMQPVTRHCLIYDRLCIPDAKALLSLCRSEVWLMHGWNCASRIHVSHSEFPKGRAG